MVRKPGLAPNCGNVRHPNATGHTDGLRGGRGGTKKTTEVVTACRSWQLKGIYACVER